MEGPISSSTFSEKDNKIELSSKNDSHPRFEYIVDIKNYNNNIIKLRTNGYQIKFKSKKLKLRFCFKKIGHTLCILSDRMGNPIIIIGPDWYMYVCFCGLISFGYLLFFLIFWKKLNIFYKICGIFSYSMYFSSYTGAFLLNPGYPERNENSLIGKPRIKFKYCNKCKIYERIDRKIAHCIKCGICIEGFDHHCPWTGKCIGRKTIHFFNAFLYSILVVIFYFALALSYINFNNRK